MLHSQSDTGEFTKAKKSLAATRPHLPSLTSSFQFTQTNQYRYLRLDNNEGMLHTVSICFWITIKVCYTMYPSAFGSE